MIGRRSKPVAVLWRGALAVFVALALPAACFATNAISQIYDANGTSLANGALVSLEPGAHTVTLASTANVGALVGVASNDSLVQLSDTAGTASNSGAQIVVSGSAEALVSDINGTVKAGDPITASPVSGIGMKALSSTQIVGTAQANLTSVATTNQTVTGANGQPLSITVGLLPVAVGVVHYSASVGGIASFVPSWLQALASAVAGHAVSPLRALLGGLVAALGFVTVIVMLSVSIRNGIISIGRNPLAQGMVRRGLIDVMITAIGVILVTGIATYVILI